jgi:hypothetical protein
MDKAQLENKTFSFFMNLLSKFLVLLRKAKFLKDEYKFNSQFTKISSNLNWFC